MSINVQFSSVSSGLRLSNVRKNPPRWIETLAEFDCEIEHRPDRLHCDADGVSRPICKQCWGKNFTMPWIDEFERADEITAQHGMHALLVPTEVSTEEFSKLQRENPVISPLLDFLDRDVTTTRDDLRTHATSCAKYVTESTV